MTTVTYDKSVHALYIQFADADAAETIELSKDVDLEVDADAQPVGVEILNADPAFAAQIAKRSGAIELVAPLRSPAG